ncbi:MATE family efflux transporter [Myroides sp. LJL119]
MGVTLYTSRVILEQLGVSDYGIYSLVGGVVAMLGFFNSAMTSATQRYLSFDIGEGNEVKLQKTFSATLTIHYLISFIALLLAETLGLWYINYEMVYPLERTFAVNVVYQFSVFTFLVSVVQVPYNALIIARERMSVYAYVSIIEVFFKLIIVFLLSLGSDKLILYSILVFVVTFIMRIVYKLYCKNNFKESRYKFEYNLPYFSELLIYSGWNLFGNFAVVARGQGINILLNLFFGTLVNAAYGITMQVQSAVYMFVNNFQMAVNPQIIKLYAKDEKERMVNLIFQSSKLSFMLILLLVFPLVFNINIVLEIWLGKVPLLTNIFCKLALICVLIDSLSGSLMTGVQASGNIKNYQVVVGIIVFLNLPISFMLLKYSASDASVVFMIMVALAVVALIFRVYFLKKILYFSIINYCKDVIVPCLIITVLSTCVFTIVDVKLEIKILNFAVNSILQIFICLVGIYQIGLSKKEQLFLKDILISKFKKNI